VSADQRGLRPALAITLQASIAAARSAGQRLRPLRHSFTSDTS